MSIVNWGKLSKFRLLRFFLVSLGLWRWKCSFPPGRGEHLSHRAIGLSKEMGRGWGRRREGEGQAGLPASTNVLKLFQLKNIQYTKVSYFEGSCGFWTPSTCLSISSSPDSLGTNFPTYWFPHQWMIWINIWCVNFTFTCIMFLSFWKFYFVKKIKGKNPQCFKEMLCKLFLKELHLF